ncbi:MAG: hypothetical protein U0587_01660 [Candidatus Binatia bacterium]
MLVAPLLVQPPRGGGGALYIRPLVVRKGGKTYRYFRLVRSVRRNGKVKQETVAYLGELDARGRREAQALAERSAVSASINSGRSLKTCRVVSPKPLRFAWTGCVGSASGSSAMCGWG